MDTYMFLKSNEMVGCLMTCVVTESEQDTCMQNLAIHTFQPIFFF